jgi:predicted AlkP superfamily pyrophosphatase or phosphodiesterase
MTRFILAFIFLLGPGLLRAGTPAGSSQAPKLVVVIVIDQMRADYLDRFADLYGESGFGILTTKGAVFTDCAYGYASTYTGPGHATILSGIPVRVGGIIGNEWYDRNKQRVVYCVEDSSVKSVGISPEQSAGRMSPVNFQGSTLGDQLLDASPSSRVIGIAIKDRGAILLAGRHPTGAIWFDPQSGKWISSSYYYRALPSWVGRFNAANIAEGYLGRTWTPLLPDSCYARAGADDAPGEGTLPGEDRPVFPHVVRDLAGGGISSNSLRRFDAVLPTPFGDELTVKFAEAALEGEELGQRGVPDLLAVSFSSLDYCGHIFGPDSREMEDLLVRLDRSLRELFSFIDARVGLGNVAIVLTADHGVCPLPEKKIAKDAMRIDPKDFLTDVKVRVGQELNYNEGDENLILALSNSFLYLDRKKIESRGFTFANFEKVVIGAASSQKGVVRCYTRGELESLSAGAGSDDLVGRRLAGSLNDRRSGDIAVLIGEYSFFSGGTTGTTHGSPWYYDRHVPLLFFGPGIAPGKYGAGARPNDIAPTLAKLLGVPPPPGSDGTVLGIFPGDGPDAAATLLQGKK